MKKTLFLLVIAALLFSCQKEKEPVATDQEVTFGATLVQDNLKDGESLPPCVLTATPTHAHIVITYGNPVQTLMFDPQVFNIGGKWYTQAIKLPVGTYQVTTFFLFVDSGPAGYDGGDLIVFATPVAPSPYTIYLTHQLPYTIEITGFTKVEYDIEVLCFLNLEYQNFGFFWFDITEIIIREACFFGDLCLENFALWDLENNHPYGTLAGGDLWPDEEALIEVDVYVNGVLKTTWNNSSIYALGFPLCVEYPDVVGVLDTWDFVLRVLVPDPVLGFKYTYYATFSVNETTNTYAMVAGTDLVIDFAIGDCSPDSQYVWPWAGPH